jgi:hypothetical protein
MKKKKADAIDKKRMLLKDNYSDKNKKEFM